MGATIFDKMYVYKWNVLAIPLFNDAKMVCFGFRLPLLLLGGGVVQCFNCCFLFCPRL